MAKLGYFELISVIGYVLALIPLLFPEFTLFLSTALWYERAAVILLMIFVPALPIIFGRRNQIKSILCGFMPFSDNERAVMAIAYFSPNMSEEEISKATGIEKSTVHMLLYRLKRRRLIEI